MTAPYTVDGITTDIPNYTPTAAAHGLSLASAADQMAFARLSPDERTAIVQNRPSALSDDQRAYAGRINGLLDAYTQAGVDVPQDLLNSNLTYGNGRIPDEALNSYQQAIANPEGARAQAAQQNQAYAQRFQQQGGVLPEQARAQGLGAPPAVGLGGQQQQFSPPQTNGFLSWYQGLAQPPRPAQQQPPAQPPQPPRPALQQYSPPQMPGSPAYQGGSQGVQLMQPSPQVGGAGGPPRQPAPAPSPTGAPASDWGNMTPQQTDAWQQQWARAAALSNNGAGLQGDWSAGAYNAQNVPWTGIGAQMGYHPSGPVLPPPPPPPTPGYRPAQRLPTPTRPPAFGTNVTRPSPAIPAFGGTPGYAGGTAFRAAPSTGVIGPARGPTFH